MTIHSREDAPASERRATVVRLVVVMVATVIAAPVLAFVFVAGAMSGGIGVAAWLTYDVVDPTIGSA